MYILPVLIKIDITMVFCLLCSLSGGRLLIALYHGRHEVKDTAEEVPFSFVCTGLSFLLLLFFLSFPFLAVFVPISWSSDLASIRSQ